MNKIKDKLLSHRIIDSNNCWNWTMYVEPRGYGRIRYKGKTTTPHKVSYLEFVGLIPEGLELDHLCKNKKCFNPDHLEPVTRKENNIRSNCSSAINSRKTHCKKGHEYSGDNLRTWKNTGGKLTRRCGECEKIRMKKRWIEKRK
jgi:hypothetical protein